MIDCVDFEVRDVGESGVGFEFKRQLQLNSTSTPSQNHPFHRTNVCHTEVELTGPKH